jgi:hypothetical protein
MDLKSGAQVRRVPVIGALAWTVSQTNRPIMYGQGFHVRVGQSDIAEWLSAGPKL